MGYSGKILADSISPDGARLTTMEMTYPRMVHAEHLRHRCFSFSVASTRAIPAKIQINKVAGGAYFPQYWGKAQKGMVAEEQLIGEERDKCIELWDKAKNTMVDIAEQLTGLGLHKQITGRLLEPFNWVTCIVSGTEWANFFHLRCASDAQPEIRLIARMARDAYYGSTPKPLSYGEWHLPLIDTETIMEVQESYDDADIYPLLCKISVGRCARVSYLTHDGKRDVNADIELCDRLITSGHWSPFEHAATPIPTHIGKSWSGNFYGWEQLRKRYAGENKRQLEKDPAAYDR